MVREFNLDRILFFEDIDRLEEVIECVEEMDYRKERETMPLSLFRRSSMRAFSHLLRKYRYSVAYKELGIINYTSPVFNEYISMRYLLEECV